MLMDIIQNCKERVEVSTNLYQMPLRLTKLGVAVSKKMTDTAGTVRGVVYGGKMATGMVPTGTRAIASRASGVLPTGLAPPPCVPGKGFPGGTRPLIS